MKSHSKVRALRWASSQIFKIEIKQKEIHFITRFERISEPFAIENEVFHLKSRFIEIKIEICSKSM